jgi:hypothetical protein
MRLRSFTVAFKFLDNKENLGGIPFTRRLRHKSTLC